MLGRILNWDLFVGLAHGAALVAGGQPSWGLASDGGEKGHGGGGVVFKI